MQTPQQITRLKCFLSTHIRQELEEEIPPGEAAFWNYWEDFVEHWINFGRSMQTVKSVRNGLRIIAKSCRILTVEQLNSIELENALMGYCQANHLTKNTYNTYRKNANTYVIWLKKRGIVEKNNIKENVEKATLPTKEQPVMSESEMSILFHYLSHRKPSNFMEKYRDLLFFEILELTGARKCEILGMSAEDIILGDDRKLTIRIGGRKQKARMRYYDCPDYLIDTVQKYYECRLMRRFNSDHLFVSSRRDKKLTIDGVSNMYKRWSREVGFKVSGHRVRRYVATKLNQEGVPILEIARHLGHTRTATTELYIERSGVLTRNTTQAMKRASKSRRANLMSEAQSILTSDALSKIDKW